MATPPPPPPIGTIGWFDLTVPSAPVVRAFYERVAGWTATPLSMGDYDDYIMSASGTGAPVGGVCNARGKNAELPAAWLMYITVADLEASLTECEASGGRILSAPRNAGGPARFAVIEDPAGAPVALYDAGVRDAS